MPDCAQCFGCGSDNPAALHLQFFSSGDEVLADVIPPKHFEGPSGYVSQAAILAIMDEIQGRVSWAEGVLTVTAGLDVRFLLPVPLGEPLHAVARLVSKGQRSYRTEAALRRADGRLAATSTTVHAVPRSGTFGA